MKKGIIFGLILVLVLMTGCQGASTETTEQAQGIYEEKIVVGTTGAQEGPLAFIGKPYFDAMKAYFQMYNENGGIEGREIELEVMEDQFKPETAIANVQKLINDEKVFSLVGLFGTPGVKASIPKVKTAGIPAVYFATGAKAPTEAGENFFPVQPNYYYEGQLMAHYAVNHFNAEKIAVIYRSDDVGLDGLSGIKEGLKTLGKEDALVEELSFDAGATDFTAQVAKVKESDADILINYSLAGGVSGVLKELEKIGMENLPHLCPYPNVSPSLIAANSEAAPKAIQNLYGMAWVDVNRPAVQDFLETMEKYYPDTPANAYAMSGWIAAETFVVGLEEALTEVSIDELTWDAYLSAMERIEHDQGIVPMISYHNGSRNGVEHMALTQVVGDTWELQTEYQKFGE